MAAGSDYAVGSASLAALLAAHTAIVSVTPMGGTLDHFTSSYYAGYATGSVSGNDGGPVMLFGPPRDTRIWYVVWNS